MSKLKITVLVENTAGKQKALAEHGLSFLLETDDKQILFDTGQGHVIENNLQHMKIDLAAVDTLILSHGHYDHTGGLHLVLPEMCAGTRLYAHPAAFDPKYSRNPDGTTRYIGMAEINKQAIADHAELISVESCMSVYGDLRLTGPVPRLTDFEDTGGPFFKDASARIPDDIADDQSAFIDTAAGTVVILGCAHSGIINVLRYIQTLTGNRPIHTVIGGMHLHNASEERIDRTMEELHRLDIQRLIPCHCTGFAASARMWNEFPGKCMPCRTGSVIAMEV